MAVGSPCDVRVTALHCFRLCSGRAQSLAGFFQTALDFRHVSTEIFSDAQTRTLTDIGGRALRITLALGAQRVELIQFIDRPGQPYPVDSSASDLLFQHFALVVSDMTAAMQSLSAQLGWTPISSEGPQRLPASSGGVSAFKFRDPEGHPLELLAFPEKDMPAHWKQVLQDAHGDSPFLGIDHSAICVSDGTRSVSFYESLGLIVSNRSVNSDPAQAKLDDLDRPFVDVIAMSADQATPHLELLCYRNRDNNDSLDLQANDVAATSLVFEADDRSKQNETPDMWQRSLIDPDGHRLVIAPSAA